MEALTSSYIAQPNIFSATMTGPDTEKMEPSCSSSASCLFFLELAGAMVDGLAECSGGGVDVEVGDVVVEVVVVVVKVQLLEKEAGE